MCENEEKVYTSSYFPLVLWFLGKLGFWEDGVFSDF